MRSYQETVLKAMEDVAESFRVPVIVSYNFGNCGVVIAGSPFSIAARAAFDFQPDRTMILFNGVPLGPTDMSFRWEPHEAEKAAAMLAKWRELLLVASQEPSTVSQP